jgi:hypothetical protein
MSTEQWRQFAAQLADHLHRLADADTVILRHGNHYVQVHQFPERVHAEAVSDEFLPTDERLPPGADQRMTTLGWKAPGPHGYRNWWYELSWPARTQAARGLADLLVTTLHEIYRVERPQDLAYRAFNVNTGEPLTLTALAPLSRVD